MFAPISNRFAIPLYLHTYPIFILVYMTRHSDHLRRKKSAVMGAPVNFSLGRPTLSTFSSPIHAISPLPALDRTVVNISKNTRGQIGSIACTESYTHPACRDEVSLNISPTVAFLLSRPDIRLSPISNFPCRGLPPLGVSPQCLDEAEHKYLGVSMLLFTPRIMFDTANSLD